MSELITKQAMKDMITNHWSDFSNEANYRTALACVDAVPSIQPKRGKWIDTGSNEEWYAREYSCSECGGTMLGDANFCPNCGAKMEVTT